MDHSFIIKNEIIERYILNQLSEDESIQLEEHLLFCEDCRKNLTKMEVVIKSIKSFPANSLKIAHKNISIYKYFSIAASILLLLSFTFLFYNKTKFENNLAVLNHSLDILKDSVQFQQKNNVELNKQLISLNKRDTLNINVKDKSKLLAQNFVSNQDLERLIGEEVRSDNFKVFSTPTPGHLKKSISVNWESNEIVKIVIYDNQRKSILSINNPKSPVVLKNKFDNGKYYLTIQTTDGIIKYAYSFLYIDGQYIY